MKNLISVIITTYNRRMMLETAIKSVISQKCRIRVDYNR